MPGLNGRRVAVVAGVRTAGSPKQARSPKTWRAVIWVAYAAAPSSSSATNLDGDEVDEVGLRSGRAFGARAQASDVKSASSRSFRKDSRYSVKTAHCAYRDSGIASDQIVLGNANIAIAGGAEALSDLPILRVASSCRHSGGSQQGESVGAASGRSRNSPRAT